MAATNATLLAMFGSTSTTKTTTDLMSVSADILSNRKFSKTSHCLSLCPLVKRSRSLQVTLGHKRDSLFPILCSTAAEPPAAVLRRILASPGLHQGPACHDALSAKLVENAGFTFAFMSGFSVAASRLALPDTGLISYGEMVEQGALITAAVSIPVIGDADNGYGNALNVKRTVKGYIKAGFAGILLEDQAVPKACGHTKGRKVVSREEAVMRIKAAVDARAESSQDIVIVGRTDARQAVSMEEALWRAQAMADAGADVIFADALCSKDELRALCKVAPGTPKMANMLEGGGKTPILTPMELEELGFKIVSYPLSLIGVAISAMQDALLSLKSGRMPPPADLPSFEVIKKVVGFDSYYEEESRYLLSASPDFNSKDVKAKEIEATESPIGLSSFSDTDELPSAQNPEADLIIPDVLEDQHDEFSSAASKIWARTLRVKVTANNEVVKLNVRIPAGFLDGLAKIIPGVAGINLAGLLDESAHKFEGNLKSGQELLDINDGRGDRIQIFLE